MDRARRIAALWNWLPAFRAIAETEHLPGASKQLHVSTSALSRSLRLLEAEVGQPLFERVGRSLVINRSGERLLSAVRDGMRLVDSALSRFEDAQSLEPVRIALSPALPVTWLLPALSRLRADHPRLAPALCRWPTISSTSVLEQGFVDLVLTLEGAPAEGLQIHRVGALSRGIYVGRGHPLYGRTVELSEILSHPFVAPSPQDLGISDQWPLEHPRRIGLFADVTPALEIARSGAWIAHLPEIAVPNGPELWRVADSPAPPSAIYAFARHSQAASGPVEAALAALGAPLRSMSV